jgi:electron transport complex protein RnfG
MKEIAKLGVILLIIGSVAAALLAMTYELTIDQILQQRLIKDQTARMEVFPGAETFEAAPEEVLNEIKSINPAIADVYQAMAAGEVKGYVIKTRPGGFGGSIDVVTGFNLEGEITGLRVGTHEETPGLGANITLPDFYTQFEGLNLNKKVGVNKVSPGDNEIQAIAGATISSQAVTDGVNYISDVLTVLEK